MIDSCTKASKSNNILLQRQPPPLPPCIVTRYEPTRQRGASVDTPPPAEDPLLARFRELEGK